MPPTPLTGQIMNDLLVTASADGVACVHVAAVVRHSHRTLLLHCGDGDTFSPAFWQVPTGLLLAPADTLPDVINRVVTHTAGLDLDQITSYLGHHDQPCADGDFQRTFAFTVTAVNPARMRRSALSGHQWIALSPLPLTLPAGTTPASRYLIGRAAGLPAARPARRQQEPACAAALRAGASGLLADEAACDLLISSPWPHRADFTRFIDSAISVTDGVTNLAHIDWAGAITALRAGELPCSSGERRILHLAASLADGYPVDLREALTGLDETNLDLVVHAVQHANGRRPT
jgi:hypothetical protein